MKKILLFLILFSLVIAGCDVTVSIAPTNPAPLPTSTAIPASATPGLAMETATQIPASPTPILVTIAPSATATVPAPSFNGVEVAVVPLRVVLPPNLAYGARGSQILRVDGRDVPAWELMPSHTQLKLEGYPLQGTSQQPQIYVYPAQDYAEMVPAAFESMHRLENIILGDPDVPVDSNQLPAVPFFNAQQVFAARVQMLAFQSGWGVRFLTEYAQYPASANNHDLFYHFQGLTSDGAYYIIAILPIRVPVLAETSDGGAVLPVGGVPYPYFADPNSDMQSYYTSVTDLLNATPSQSFNPTLDQLDAFIQSIRIMP